MLFKGQLEQAQLENKSSDPSNLPNGRIWLNTTADVVKAWVQGAIRTFVTTDQTQTLTNKTLTSPAITTPTGIVKGDVGLGNVDNTSDATKNAAAVSLTNKTIDADLNTITNIENADIKTGAAIDRTKLASGTNNHVIINSGAGVLASEATLAKVRGGTGQDNSSLTFPATGTIATVTGTETFTNKTIDGDNNTVQDLPLTALKADAGNANKFITRNGSGIVVHNKTVPVGEVVGTTDAASLSNKSFNGSTYFEDDGVNFEILPAAPIAPVFGYEKLYNRGNKFYTLNSYGVETEVGSGSGGGVNFIIGGAAEGSNIWSQGSYGTSFPAPTNSTPGGTPTVTSSVTTSNPLAGNSSFLLTKGGSANRRGDYWAINFSLSQAYVHRAKTVSFDYIVNSGTFTASDVTVWLQDNTTGEIIQPSNYQLTSTSSTVAGRFEAQFQGSGSGYILMIYVAGNSTANWSLLVDNVSVSPSTYVYGSPVTDWQAETRMTTSGFGISPTVNVFSRRVGDSLQVNANIRITNTGGSLSAHIINFSGISIDFGKLPNDLSFGVGEVGYAAYLTNGAATHGGVVVCDFNNGGLKIRSVGGSATTWTTSTSAGTPVNTTVGDTIKLNFTLPITGWSSSVQMSDSADTRVVAARAYRGTSQVVGPNGGFVKVLLDTITNDTHAAFSTSNNQFTAPVAGWYQISAGIGFIATNVLNNRYIGCLYKNGSLATLGNAVFPKAGGAFGMGVSDTMYLNAGEVISVYLYGEGNNSASTITVVGSSPDTYFSVSKVSGPSAIAATETIAVRASNTAGQTMTHNAWTVITFPTEDVDTHGALSGTTFTAPAPGLYMATLHAGTTLNTAASGEILTKILKNGSDYAWGTRYPIGSSDIYCSTSSLVRLAAGDTLTFALYHTNGTNRNLKSADPVNYVSIHRIGL